MYKELFSMQDNEKITFNRDFKLTLGFEPTTFQLTSSRLEQLGHTYGFFCVSPTPSFP